MIMKNPGEGKPTKILTVTNTCKSPFEYMQQQRLISKFQAINEQKQSQKASINDLQKFNREQQSNMFKNKFPK